MKPNINYTLLDIKDLEALRDEVNEKLLEKQKIEQKKALINLCEAVDKYINVVGAELNTPDYNIWLPNLLEMLYDKEKEFNGR